MARAKQITEEPPAPSGPSTGKRAILWLERAQEDFALALLQATGLVPSSIGVADASSRGRAEALSGAFPDAEQATDPRQALATTEADLALFLTPTGARDALDDASVLASAVERGLKLATLEPTPASALDFARFEKLLGQDEPVRVIPALTRAPVFTHALDLLEQVGPVRTLSVATRCARGQGSLFARLFDAMDIVLSLLGEPETIDAAVCGPVVPGRVHLAPGDSLRDLRGDLTANLRYAGACAASLSLSDNAGRWFRGVTLVGHGGCLRFDDTSYEFIDPSGKTVDSSAASDRRGRKNPGAAHDLAASACAQQIHAMFDLHAPRSAPRKTSTVLAMAEAALLSARTGTPESPGSVLRMAGAM
jgi:predicted dehydrogenase